MTEPLNNRSTVASQEDRMRLLNDALARAIPESRTWERKRYPSAPNTPGESTHYIEVFSPVRPNEQSLFVQLRYDGDIQVVLVVPHLKSSPK